LHHYIGTTSARIAGYWWVEYQDAQLDRLVTAAIAENPTLEQALARLRLAQATVAAVHSALLPSLSYDAGESRGPLSGKDVIPHPYAGTKVWRGSEQLNFSWELDFWGRQASLLRQARSDANATALDAEAARLAIIGAVVRAYFELERAYELVEVAARTRSAGLFIGGGVSGFRRRLGRQVPDPRYRLTGTASEETLCYIRDLSPAA
jgi:outer membrane protein TolC